MLAKVMCSKNPEVGTLFAQFITKVFLIQRIFRVLRNSFFSEQTTFIPSSRTLKNFSKIRKIIRTQNLELSR